MAQIAAKLQGVRAEKRASQERIAGILGISRQSAGLRLNARVPIPAHELTRLARAFDVPVERFFPDDVRSRRAS